MNACMDGDARIAAVIQIESQRKENEEADGSVEQREHVSLEPVAAIMITNRYTAEEIPDKQQYKYSEFREEKASDKLRDTCRYLWILRFANQIIRNGSNCENTEKGIV